MAVIDFPQAASQLASFHSGAENVAVRPDEPGPDQLVVTRASKLMELERVRNTRLAMVAHELRNALAPVAAGLDLLALKLPAGAAGREIIPMARRQLRHMAILVSDLVDLGRLVNDGGVSLDCAQVSLQELTDAALAACGPLADARFQNLSRYEPSPAIWVNADPARMSQVLLNVLGNAIKFTPEGGAIHLRCFSQGRVARVCITDSGVGIEPARLERMFDMFCHRDDPQPGEGLGIGLSVSRRLVELHGGTLTASSDGPGKGSTFTIELPLAGMA